MRQFLVQTAGLGYRSVWSSLVWIDYFGDVGLGLLRRSDYHPPETGASTSGVNDQQSMWPHDANSSVHKCPLGIEIKNPYEIIISLEVGLCAGKYLLEKCKLP